MKNKLKFIDLFCGIGGFHSAVKKINPNAECVFACDIDKHAIETYEKNYGIKVTTDIRKVDEKDIPEHDLLCGGFPCVAFSCAGKRNGFMDARGTLFFEIERILRHHKTKYILLENVKHLVKHDSGKTWKVITSILKDIGYRLATEPLILCPTHIGTPQLRPRVFIAGMYDPENVNRPLELHIPKQKLKNVYDLLDDKVDSKYNISKEEENILEIWNEFVMTVGNTDCIGLTIIPEYFKLNSKNIDSSYLDRKKNDIVKNVALYNKHKTFIDSWLKKHNNLEDLPPSRRRMEWHANTTIKSVYEGFIQIRQSGVRVKKPTAFPTLVAIVQTSIVGKLKRRLTPRECARLQNFDDDFVLCKNDYQAYKQMGNSVNVNVVSEVLKQLLETETPEISFW